ncbi:MAG: hypothetical protein ACRDYA_09055 [Egibacteraceae bacterium]
MALLTYLVKVSEDDRSVVYRFGPREDELQMGLIELDKLTERFRELEPLQGRPPKHTSTARRRS